MVVDVEVLVDGTNGGGVQGATHSDSRYVPVLFVNAG